MTAGLICFCAAIAQLVERILGKDEVPSSNLGSSSKSRRSPMDFDGFSFYPSFTAVENKQKLSPMSC